ncbi:MAG: hypothetical protein LBP76_13445 [Treponema sp.]|jgi:hypothetical protein|nr:hypothetical protein [Treponema sp.]
MFDMRINGIIAGLAFIISVLVGSLSGGAFLIVLLRALIFAVVFFVIAAGINLAVSRFLPELLDMNDNDRPGSHIDVTVEDEDNPIALPDEDSEGDVDNIGELVGESGGEGEGSFENIMEGTGLDRPGKNGYTVNTEAGEDTSFSDNKSIDPHASPLTDKQAMSKPNIRTSADVQDFQPAIPSRSSEDADSVDVLPDLEDMAKAFLPSEGADKEESAFEDAPQKKQSKSGKGKSLAGDFSSKDMAQALQTILKREE